MLPDAILVPTWFHFGSQNLPKSRLGDVLRRLGGVLERLGGVLGESWCVLGGYRTLWGRSGRLQSWKNLFLAGFRGFGWGERTDGDGVRADPGTP